MIESLRIIFRPFWRVLKTLLLSCGVPLETLQNWKLHSLSILHKIFFFRGFHQKSLVQLLNKNKWTIEHDISLNAQIDYYKDILNDEWNKINENSH